MGHDLGHGGEAIEPGPEGMRPVPAAAKVSRAHAENRYQFNSKNSQAETLLGKEKAGKNRPIRNC